MKLFEFLLNLLRSLFGGKSKPQKELPPVAEDPAPEPEPQPEPLPEPEDQPEEEFDDLDYNVEEVTEDDETEREALDEEDEPEEEVVLAVEAQMLPLDSWKERQKALADLGFDPGKIDGIPGRKTSAAMRRAEKEYGLEQDGEWDIELHQAISDALKEKGKPKIAPMPIVPPPVGEYDDMLDPSEYQLDDAFFASFIDLTHKSNVVKNGSRRRKGRRKWSRLTRFCWHQTAFVWRPYLESKRLGKYTGHHKMNAHMMFDRDGTILLLHNFFYYLWTANAFNPDCISIEVLGNFEGIQGNGKWYKGDKFGRARPTRMQLIRCRQFTIWMHNPELGPEDDKLPKPLLEWRLHCRKEGNPLKWVNTHRESADQRNGDCGSELWYHLCEWAYWYFKGDLTQGPKKGKGKDIPAIWRAKPPAPPLPLDTGDEEAA